MTFKVILLGGQMGYGENEKEARFNAALFPLFLPEKKLCVCGNFENKGVNPKFCTNCGNYSDITPEVAGVYEI